MGLRGGTVALIVLLGIPARAIAKTPRSSVEEARVRYQTGLAQYREGHYQEALDSFVAVYALLPRAELLLNMAEAHVALKQLPQARNLYERFLTEAPAHPRAPAARKSLAEIDAQLPRREPAVASPTVPAAAMMTTAPAPAPAKSRSRRVGLIVGLTLGSVAVVATAITLGVVFGTRETDPRPSMGGFVVGN
jgi:hypothetical protein